MSADNPLQQLANVMHAESALETAEARTAALTEAGNALVGCITAWGYGDVKAAWRAVAGSAAGAQPEPECNGICVMGTDLIGGVSPDLVAHAHPECELHGAGAQPAEEET